MVAIIISCALEGVSMRGYGPSAHGVPAAMMLGLME